MNPSPQSSKVKPLVFEDPVATVSQDIESELRKRGSDGQFLGAVTYQELPGNSGEFKGIIHIGNPYSEQGEMRITSMPTMCTREELEGIRRKIIWMPETCALFEILAANYHLRQNLALEGPSSLGKTWVTGKFFECVFGPGFEPVYICCNRDLQARDLFAKWAPRDSTELDPKIVRAVEAYLKTSKGAESRKNIAELQEALGDTDPEVCKTIIQGEYLAIAEKLGLLKDRSEYVRELGPVPQAYLSKRGTDGSYTYPDQGGEGRPIFIDELTRAKPDFHNGIIGIRGSNRELKPRLTMQEHGGKVIQKGKLTSMIVAMNPADEDFEGVTKIDPALARAFVWVVLKDLSPESYRMAANSFLAFGRDDKPQPMVGRKPFDYMSNPELLKQMGEVLAHMHICFKERFGAWMRTRDQKIPTTLDDMASFAKEVYLYPVTKPGGSIDVAETMRHAFRNTYMAKSTDEKLTADLEKDMESILTAKETATKRWRGMSLTREQILNKLGEELSLSPAERKKIAMGSLQGAVNDAAADAMVPQSVRDALAQMMK